MWLTTACGLIMGFTSGTLLMMEWWGAKTDLTILAVRRRTSLVTPEERTILKSLADMCVQHMDDVGMG